MIKTKKYVISIGAVAVVLMMLSTVTAVTANEQQHYELEMESQEVMTVEEILEFIDLEGFRELFTSPGFADLMKSDIIQDFINSDEYQSVQNTNEMNEFVESEIVQDLINSEEAEIFIENCGDIDPFELFEVLLMAIIVGFIIWIAMVIVNLPGPIYALLDAINYLIFEGDILGAVAVYLFETLVAIGLILISPLFALYFVLSEYILPYLQDIFPELQAQTLSLEEQCLNAANSNLN